MNTLVSVIIPIYKVEAYLQQCIESVVNQSFHNLEIILVDDGSPDNCPAICDEYAKKDNRIKIIHKENGGLSDARNAGLDLASGDYIFFVDSDDFITTNCIQELVNEIQKGNYDVAIAKHTSSFLPSCPKVQSKELTTNYQIAKAFCETKFSPCAWNKLYKTRFIKDNGLRFFKGILFEDQLWSLQWVTQASRICLLSNITYVYNTRSASIMESCSADLEKSLNSWKIILGEYRKLLSTGLYPNELTGKILIQKIEESLYLSRKDFKQFNESYKKVQDIIPIQPTYAQYKARNFIKRALYKATSFLPLPIFQILLYFHIKLK
jgi:glycosyltransferase involved in cell wall biosynthesis